MPELPDIELYLTSLRERILGAHLVEIRLLNSFVLRSVLPKPAELIGSEVLGLRRIGKRIVIEFEDQVFAIIHLMVAGRLRWGELGAKLPAGKVASAVLEFDSGVLFLTEAGSKKRASLTLVHGENALTAHDPGGIEPLQISTEEFAKALRAGNHTLKVRLTDPHVYAGIGNAYSDEILFKAQLSPLKQTGRIDDAEVVRLFEAVREVLTEATQRLREQFAGRFPGAGDVTAFRPEFAVHGKFGKPCPKCGEKVLRIRYAENECNYCAVCQNSGKQLADRSMSRLLK